MIEDRLSSIKKFFRKNRRLPSYSEMLKLFNISSKNAVFKIINKLIDLGFIEKESKKLSPTKKFFALPLLGIIKAVFPILADDYLIENPQTSFLLKVSGDSMTGVGIFEGDIVIIERKKDINTGSIVLAQIDNEWTLKILKTDRKKHINYLEAANPKYPPFYPINDLQIYGIVRGVIRKIN